MREQMIDSQKLYWTILARKDLGFPYVTLCLALSCLIISVPIIYSAKYYDTFALWSENPQPWQYITFQFCHGEPGGVNFWPHFLTNLIFIALFGSVIERLIGAGRFFSLSLATFSTFLIRTTFLTNTVSNGASGICWGYLAFTVPILVWIWHKRKNYAFSDVSFVLATVCAIFGIFGLAMILWFEDHSIINNTNIAHVVSILTAVPFLFVWQKLLFNNLTKIERGGMDIEERHQSTWDKMAIASSVILLAFNTIVSIGVIAGVVA